MNVGQAFLATAERNPDLLAVNDDRGALNHAQLARIVRAFAQRMKGAGIKRGSLVAIASDDILVALPAMLATALIWARWVAAKHAGAVSAVEHPSHFLASGEASEPADPRFTLIDESWSREDRRMAAFDPGAQTFDADAPWLHFSNSGTTGTPKILTLSQAVMARLSGLVTIQPCDWGLPLAQFMRCKFVLARNRGEKIKGFRQMERDKVCQFKVFCAETRIGRPKKAPEVARRN